MADSRSVTARSLLLKFLELRRMSPELGDWTEERLKGNPPRLFRLRQLTARFRAYRLPWDLPAFMVGTFIRAEQPRYAPLFSRLVEEMPQGADHWADGRQLPEFFGIPYKYRERLDGVLSFSCGVLEASGLFLLAHRKADALNRVIQGNAAVIEDVLAELISPEAAVFSMEQLTQDYGYPEVAPFEIDSEWW